MLSLNAVPALSSQPMVARPDPSGAAGEAASTSAAITAAQIRTQIANLQLTGPSAAAANAMKGLSTVAVAEAMSSVPAALGRLNDIVMANSSSALTDADRTMLQHEYSNLSNQVDSTVGMPMPSTDTSGTADKGKDSSSSDSNGQQHGQGSGKGSGSGSGQDRSHASGTYGPVKSAPGAKADRAPDGAAPAGSVPTPERPAIPFASAAGGTASAPPQFVPPTPTTTSRISLVA